MKFSLTTYITLYLATAALALAEVTVTASFQPASIHLGDTAQYIVAIKETSDSGKPEIERVTSLPIPHAGGLTLQNGRTSTSQQSTIRNLDVQHSITQSLIIEAIAPRVGNFTIPRYTLTYKGNTYTAPAATLNVTERPANAPPPINEMIFLKVDAPEELYIGQTTQIELKLYVHEQARYRGYDNFNRSADGFTVSELPEPTDVVERIGDSRYQVISWPLTITPIQAGPQDLNFEFSVVAEIPQQNNRRDPFGRSNSFGNSIFDSFFSRSERFNLFNEPTQINVLPLPESGQPDSFSGAVGDFRMELSTDAEGARVGEPIMLSMKITGTGNFDRISGPKLPESPTWRSYDPESTMEAASTNSSKETKRFDYVLIPMKPGKHTLPAVKFSFFDPKDKTYIELDAPPISVDVAPSLQPQYNAPVTSQTTETKNAEVLSLQKQLNPEEALLTLDYRPRAVAPSGFAILKQPLFYLMNLLVAIALGVAIWILRKRQRLATDKDYAQRQAARAELKVAVAASKQAAQNSDAVEFFRHAQEAIRLAATARFGQNLRAAELAQVQPLFEANKIAESAIEATAHIFAQADALRFSGQSAQADLNAAREQLETVLKAL
ncbi:MAG: BatD family protein [Opitutaceae bacterium]